MTSGAELPLLQRSGFPAEWHFHYPRGVRVGCGDGAKTCQLESDGQGQRELSGFNMPPLCHHSVSQPQLLLISASSRGLVTSTEWGPTLRHLDAI